VIQGLAVSLEATALPTIVIVGGILVTFNLAGLFGIAIAVTTMLGSPAWSSRSTPSVR
jgi:K(+)-stimulated pyrophosphate-energized sodium pump